MLWLGRNCNSQTGATKSWSRFDCWKNCMYSHTTAVLHGISACYRVTWEPKIAHPCAKLKILLVIRRVTSRCWNSWWLVLSLDTSHNWNTRLEGLLYTSNILAEEPFYSILMNSYLNFSPRTLKKNSSATGSQFFICDSLICRRRSRGLHLTRASKDASL